jgi:ABC-2 type transport system ATP-binding protein
MTEIALSLNHVAKTFGRGKKQVQALKNLDLEVQAGQVYGFLGPNGAGKTTTIRILLDLIRPTRGQAAIYGRDPRRDHGVLGRVGAIVEGAAFYPFLSGRRNLEVLARTGGACDRGRIDALLEQVGLAERAGQYVRGYSTGMKQRLGLAAALLSDPDLLILDEPTNGLDPAGIQEMRVFIRDLVDRHGKTVFLSSHILSEIEQVCDRVGDHQPGPVARRAVTDCWPVPPDCVSKPRRLARRRRRAGRALAVSAQRPVDHRPADGPPSRRVRALVAAEVDVSSGQPRQNPRRLFPVRPPKHGGQPCLTSSDHATSSAPNGRRSPVTAGRRR